MGGNMLSDDGAGLNGFIGYADEYKNGIWTRLGRLGGGPRNRHRAIIIGSWIYNVGGSGK